MAGLFETPQVPRLPTLLAEVRNGAILIPDFQRPLQWDDDRRLTLLDSVAKQMPIGAFMVWRTRDNTLRCLDTLGAFHLPKVAGPQIPRAYLLDGHQRLATLFAALSWTDDPAPLHKQGVRWPIYYDLEAAPDDQAFRFHSRKGDAPTTWLPLYALFDPKRLFAHQKRLLDNPRDGENRAQVLAERAEALAERFKDYQIPVIPLVSEDLSLVTESFVRVNSEGKRMRETNMVRALAYSPDRDLERELEALKAELAPLGWGGMDDQLLLNVLKAHWRLNVLDTQPRKLFDKLKEDGYEKTLETLQRSVRWAIDELAAIGVRGPCALPYANQLIALADGAWQLDQPKLDAAQTKRLHAWFWATTYGEYFTGMPGKRIRDAIDYLREILTKGRDPVPPDLAREISPIGAFNFRATRTKALMLLTTNMIEDLGLRARTQSWFGELGNEAVQRLFPAVDSTRPENRVVALPEELDMLRMNLDFIRVIWEGSTEISAANRRLLLVRYMMPEDAPYLGLSRAATEMEILKTRRANMDTLESDFLASLGLELRQADDEV
jgi:hypothetical protein